MTLDPQDVAKRARESGEPELADWLQREVDDYYRDTRLGRIQTACYVIGFWAVVGTIIWWGIWG